MVFNGKLNFPVYMDNSGNIISIIHTNEIYRVVRISPDGEVKLIFSFKTIARAVQVLHQYCEAENYEPVNGKKLGYAFSW